MAVKVKPRHLNPALALERADSWSGVLKYALEHPTVNPQGQLSFQVSPAKPGGKAVRGVSRDPISKIGRPFACPRVDGNLWDLQDLVKIAVLLRDLARDVRHQI